MIINIAFMYPTYHSLLKGILKILPKNVMISRDKKKKEPLIVCQVC